MFQFTASPGSIYIAPDKAVYRIDENVMHRVSGTEISRLLASNDVDTPGALIPLTPAWLAPGVSAAVRHDHIEGVAVALGSIDFLAHPVITDQDTVTVDCESPQVPFTWSPLCSDLPEGEGAFVIAAIIERRTADEPPHPPRTTDFFLLTVHYKTQPTISARMYKLPLNNIYSDGHVCLGYDEDDDDRGNPLFGSSRLCLSIDLTRSLTRFAMAPLNDDLAPNSAHSAAMFKWDVSQVQIPFTLADLTRNVMISTDPLEALVQPLVADAIALCSDQARTVFQGSIATMSSMFLKSLDNMAALHTALNDADAREVPTIAEMEEIDALVEALHEPPATVPEEEPPATVPEEEPPATVPEEEPLAPPVLTRDTVLDYLSQHLRIERDLLEVISPIRIRAAQRHLADRGAPVPTPFFERTDAEIHRLMTRVLYDFPSTLDSFIQGTNTINAPTAIPRTVNQVVQEAGREARETIPEFPDDLFTEPTPLTTLHGAREYLTNHPDAERQLLMTTPGRRITEARDDVRRQGHELPGSIIEASTEGVHRLLNQLLVNYPEILEDYAANINRQEDMTDARRSDDATVAGGDPVDNQPAAGGVEPEVPRPGDQSPGNAEHGDTPASELDGVGGEGRPVTTPL